MFVTCHITFGQLSNFVRASLEVTRTIINHKLPFTWGCSILLLKKAKGPWHRIPFFSNDSGLFLKYLILIITYLAIHYSQNVFRGFSILVNIGVQVIFRGFVFSFLLSRVTGSRLASHLSPFDRKTLNNCACSADPGLLNETKGLWFPLSCLSLYQNGWQKLDHSAAFLIPSRKWYIHSFRYGDYLDNSCEDQNCAKRLSIRRSCCSAQFEVWGKIFSRCEMIKTALTEIAT